MDHADGSLGVLMGMILVLIEPSLDMLEVVGHADGGSLEAEEVKLSEAYKVR